MPVFINMHDCELRQIELAIHNCEDHPEFDPDHEAHTHEQVFLVGTPSEFDAETIRKEMSKKYDWVSSKIYDGELPDHLKEEE